MVPSTFLRARTQVLTRSVSKALQYPKPMGLLRLALTFFVLSSLFSSAQTLTLNNDVHRVAALAANTVATLTGKSELHLTDGGDPIPACTLHLNSENSWVFFHNVTPATVNSTLLSRVRVNGAVAVTDSNVRVVQHVAGTVVIPQPASFQPLEVFTGTHLTGPSKKLSPYAAYNGATLGMFGDNIRSFVLKRGFTATFAPEDQPGIRSLTSNAAGRSGSTWILISPDQG